VKIKFLFIRFSSIGDIVLTTPAVRCLKKQLPDAEIHYLVKNTFKIIPESNPYIDKVHVFDNDLSAVIEDLKKEYITYVIDLQKNLRSYRIKQKLPFVAFSFNKLNIEKWLLTNFKINRLPGIHIVDRYLQTLDLFDIWNDGEGLDYFIPKNQEVDTASLPPAFQQNYIGLVVGAAHATKRLPIEKIKGLVEMIRKPVVLLGGPSDVDLAEEIARINPLITYNACGKYSLHQSASLVKQAKLIISHDTGLMHIASAFKKDILSVWGNTVPGFGMYPYFPGKSSEIFEVQGLSCRPCSKIGFKKCPKGHFKCMNDISLEAIARKASNLFNA